MPAGVNQASAWFESYKQGLRVRADRIPPGLSKIAEKTGVSPISLGVSCALPKGFAGMLIIRLEGLLLWLYGAGFFRDHPKKNERTVASR